MMLKHPLPYVLCTLCMGTYAVQAGPSPDSRTVRLRVHGHYAYFKVVRFDSRQGFRPEGTYSNGGETSAAAQARSGSVHAIPLGYYYRLSRDAASLPVDYVRVDSHHIAAYLTRKQRPLIAFSNLGIRIVLPSKSERPVRSENPVFAVDNKFQYPDVPLRRHFIFLQGGRIVADSRGRLHCSGSPQTLNIVYASHATEADYRAFKYLLHLNDRQIATCDGDTACNPATRSNSHVVIVCR